MDGDVIEAGALGNDRTHSAGFEHDQHLAAGAEPKRVALLRDQFEPDDVLPDGERLGAIGDGDVDRAEGGGQRQGGRTAHGGLGFDGEDHFGSWVCYPDI